MNYDKSKYAIWTWKHISGIHWILNPVLVFNELVLGQRVPKIILFDKGSNTPLMERQIIPCPHCGELNDSRLWANGNGFKNWFGYYCCNCGQVIPCLRNLMSLIVIILTSPIWFWFVKGWKNNWLKKQPSRFENLNIDKIRLDNASLLKIGVSWAGLMFIINTFIITLIEGREITLPLILFGILLWTLGGLAFYYMLKFWMVRRTKSETK